VTGTNSNSQNPSLIYRGNDYGWYKIVWNESGKIYYENYYPDSWSGQTFVNSGSYGLITGEANPTVALVSNYDRHIAWQGIQNNQGVILTCKNLATIYDVFANSNQSVNYYKPSVTGHINGRATLTWYDNSNNIWKAIYSGAGWGFIGPMGSHGTNPSTSVMNPPGGDAKVVWTDVSTAPYALHLDGSLLNRTAIHANEVAPNSAPSVEYHRRVFLHDAQSEHFFSIELGRMVLADDATGAEEVDFVPISDSSDFSLSGSLSLLQSQPFTISSTTKSLALDRIVETKNISTSAGASSLSFELVNSVSGEVLETFGSTPIDGQPKCTSSKGSGLFLV
jgi:hypothetical protein